LPVQRAVGLNPPPFAQAKSAVPGMTAGKPAVQKPARAVPPFMPARTIQRNVGFEFEVDEVDTLSKNYLTGNFSPLKKKEKLLSKPGFFNVEADVREDGTSDME